MTKKYWQDWQKRIKETENIWMFYEPFGNKAFWGEYLLNDGDKLSKATFYKDTVVLDIERLKRGFNEEVGEVCEYVENESVEIHRTSIANIKFRKYYNQYNHGKEK